MSLVSDGITVRVRRLIVIGVSLIPHDVGLRSEPTRGTIARLMPMLMAVLHVVHFD